MGINGNAEPIEILKEYFESIQLVLKPKLMCLTSQMGDVVGTPDKEGFQFEEMRAVHFLFFHRFCVSEGA